MRGLRVLAVIAVTAALVAALLPAASSGAPAGPRPLAGAVAAHKPAKRKRHRRKRVCRVVRKRVHHRIVRRKVCKRKRKHTRKHSAAPAPGGSGAAPVGGQTAGPGGGGTTTGTGGGGTSTGSGGGGTTGTGGGGTTGPGGSTYERVDLISDNGFEGSDNPVGCFAPYAEGDGSVATTTTNPIAGAQSLSLTIDPYGRVGCDHTYDYHEGPIGQTVTIEGDVRIESPTNGDADLEVCAIVYFEDDPENVQSCQAVHTTGSGVVHVTAVQDAQGKRLASVAFQLQDMQLESKPAVTIHATLDNAHLYVDQVPGSEGPRGGGGDGGGGAGGGGGAPGDPVGRYAAMVSPTPGETFTDDALSLRLVGIGHDPNVFTNEPVNGRGMNAASVQFYLDGQPVGDPVDGSTADYHVFTRFVSGLHVAPGAHEVWARATYVNPDETLDSPHVTINVVDPPAYAQTISLDHDISVAPGQSYSLVGAPGARIRLNANGHRIVTSGGQTSGRLTLKDVDVYDLGSNSDPTSPAIDFATTGGVTIEDSTFDSSTSVDLHLNGSATASIRGNLFRSNNRMPVGQQPDENASDGTVTYPVVSIDGTSTVPKTFAGNNIGAAPVRFEHASHWTVGGTSDDDSNVFIGPRAALEARQSDHFLIEGNFINHVYYGGWSQGQLLEVEDTQPILVEHNVLFDSSWPVRGIGGEFAYNLVLEAGHEWLVPGDGAYVHHNIFIGGDNDQGGVTGYYDVNARIENNTFDGLLGPMAASAIEWQAGHTTLKSNAFLGWPTWTHAVVDVEGGTVDAGYNGFFNPQDANYLGMSAPGTDLGGGASTDPLFRGPLPTTTFDMDEVAVWRRTLPVSRILSTYRDRYTPRAGSPYIDAGDPSAGQCPPGPACNDVGAVGAGNASPLDRLGTFGG